MLSVGPVYLSATCRLHGFLSVAAHHPPLSIVRFPYVYSGSFGRICKVSSERVVSFKDSSGEVSTMGIGSVSADSLVVGIPWRTFRWRHGQAHYSGWYWSATTGRHLVYESRLELAYLLMADFDPKVVSIAAQPFCVTAQMEGRRRRHVPDFLVVDSDGLVTVVNVKPADQVNVPKVAESLGWAAKVFAERGWRHIVWSGAPSAVLANVRFLAAYRRRDRVDAAAIDDVRRRVKAPVCIGEVESAVTDRFPAEVSRPALLHLLWCGELRADLNEPLSGATVLERVA